MLEFLFQISVKKRLFHLFSSEFYEISKNIFFTSYRTPLLILQSWRLPLLLLFYLSLTFLSPLCSQLAIGTLNSVSLFYNLTNFYDSCSYLPSLLFLLPKTEFVSSFALVGWLVGALFSLLLPTEPERCQTVLLIEKCETLFLRLFLARQNAITIFRIILNIIAFYHSG